MSPRGGFATFERWIFCLGGILFVSVTVNNFCNNPIAEKINAMLLWAYILVGLAYCALKIREARRTGIVSVRFGFWTQKTDGADPMLFILMVGMYWCAAIMFTFFIFMGVLGVIRF